MIEQKSKVKYDGAYRWATVTLTEGDITVKESERVDKHYEWPGVKPHESRIITTETESAASVVALRVARDRALTILNAVIDDPMNDWLARAPRGVAGVTVRIDETEPEALHQDQYLTLTFVVRAEDPPTDDEDARALLTDDETMFWCSEMGITAQVLNLGADPSSWHEDNDKEDA